MIARLEDGSGVHQGLVSEAIDSTAVGKDNDDDRQKALSLKIKACILCLLIRAVHAGHNTTACCSGLNRSLCCTWRR